MCQHYCYISILFLRQECVEGNDITGVLVLLSISCDRKVQFESGPPNADGPAVEGRAAAAAPRC